MLDRLPPEREIKKMVEDKLWAWHNKTNQQSFLYSSVLNKKDCSSRFFLDYQALNREIIADKYPILVIDELLDKLRRASIFYKLDLKSEYPKIHITNIDVLQKKVIHSNTASKGLRVMSLTTANFQCI